MRSTLLRRGWTSGVQRKALLLASLTLFAAIPGRLVLVTGENDGRLEIPLEYR